ncbi:MAG TPA: crosslink repair DNA glycosylase YcaQ family protein [Candidatus Acidoferrales bacterium]|nr:crosslink repair DNA glycosylase YcaQ family protein [Candidatus Acidoferrales bacterium]
MNPARAAKFRRPPKITTLAEALRFIDALGFCVLYPIKELPLASLYFAVTGRDPHVEHIWDDKSEMLWRWKDELPCKRRAFYGKYLKGRGTFISLKFLPYFVAMTGSVAGPGNYSRFYDEGLISEDARAIWEAPAKHGPLPTLELRYACRMETTAGNKRFKKAILDLQRMLVVVHFGTEQETAAWASGHFELICRAFPKETEAAAEIDPHEARHILAAKYLESHPNATREHLRRIFGWSKAQAIAACEAVQK